MGSPYPSQAEGSSTPPPPLPQAALPAPSGEPASDPNRTHYARLEATLPFLPSPCLLVRRTATAAPLEVAFEVAFGGGMTPFAARLMGGEDALVELGIGAAEQEATLTRELSAKGSALATVRAIPRALPGGQAWLIEFVDDTELVAKARDVGLRGRILERLVETVPIVIAVKDPRDDYRFTLVNRCFEETFGIRRADVVGAKDEDFFPPELCAGYRKADEAAFAGKAAMVHEEGIDTALGRRQARTLKLPLFDDQGRPELLLVITQDVTDFRAAVRQAEDGRRVKARILQGLGGEMKSRISEVHEHLGQSGDAVDTEWMRRETEGLLSRIDEALEVSNLRTLGGAIGSQRVAPMELVAAAVASSTEESKSRAVTWSVHSTLETDGALDARIEVLPERLTQAIGHLVSNAIQFSPRGARASIRVGLNSCRDRLCIAVEDEGIGIPVEEQQALFGVLFEGGTTEAAVELDGASSAVGEAQGLGLTLCRQLVSSMGGTVDVASELGEGSVFTISLPWVRGKDGRPASSAASRRSSAHAGERPVEPSRSGFDQGRAEGSQDSGVREVALAAANVLLIESNLVCQRIALRHLEALGHSVTAVADLQDAVPKLRRRGRFDFALVGQGLGGGVGLDIIRQLRGIETSGGCLSPMPLLAIFSGDPSIDAGTLRSSQRASVEAGADGYLTKPLRREKIAEALLKFDRR